MKKIIQQCIALVALAIIASCGNKPGPFTEKKFTIPAKKTVHISEVDLSITNNGCGRKWVTVDDHPASEKPYCELVIKRNGTTVNAGQDFKPVYIGNLEITIDRMNPWGREEDSIPPGGCRVWVRKVEGR
jgi:hypothetical protein